MGATQKRHEHPKSRLVIVSLCTILTRAINCVGVTGHRNELRAPWAGQLWEGKYLGGTLTIDRGYLFTYLVFAVLGSNAGPCTCWARALLPSHTP